MEREGIMIVETVWDSAPEIVAFKGHDDWGVYIPERTCHLEPIPYWPGDYEGMRCSVCKTADIDMGVGSYCSVCGAKVVE